MGARERERHATIGDVIRIVESAEVLSNTDGEEPRITALSLRVPREKPSAGERNASLVGGLPDEPPPWQRAPASAEAVEDDEAMRIAQEFSETKSTEPKLAAAIRAYGDQRARDAQRTAKHLERKAKEDR